VRGLHWAGSLLIRSVRRLLFRHLPPDLSSGIRRILVFRIGNVGDVLVALPAFEAIRQRFPEARICLLTSPGQAGAPGAEDVLPRKVWFDEWMVYYASDIKPWRGRWDMLKRVRRGDFDLFIELPNQLSKARDELRNMMVARLAGCRFGFGFQISHHQIFRRIQMMHTAWRQESVRIHAAIAPELRMPFATVRLPVTPSDRKAAAQLLSALGMPEGRQYIVMHVGAKRPTNRWPLERYARVADEIARRYGVEIVLTGSAAELPVVEQVCGFMTERAFAACGCLDLKQTAALLEGACLYVGNDTGPMHLAAAVGTPVVAVFSARDFPEKWYPAGEGHIVLRQDVPCSPCFKQICDKELACLTKIHVEDVLGAVERQLSGREADAEARRA